MYGGGFSKGEPPVPVSLHVSQAARVSVVGSLGPRHRERRASWSVPPLFDTGADKRRSMTNATGSARRISSCGSHFAFLLSVAGARAVVSPRRLATRLCTPLTAKTCERLPVSAYGAADRARRSGLARLEVPRRFFMLARVGGHSASSQRRSAGWRVRYLGTMLGILTRRARRVRARRHTLTGGCKVVDPDNFTAGDRSRSPVTRKRVTGRLAAPYRRRRRPALA